MVRFNINEYNEKTKGYKHIGLLLGDKFEVEQDKSRIIIEFKDSIVGIVNFKEIFKDDERNYTLYV